MTSPLVLDQKKKGYRYSQDPFLLADFFRADGAPRLIDLGAGAGVVSILICRDNPGVTALAVEIDPSMAKIAMSNAGKSVPGRYHVVAADLMTSAEMLGGGAFDAVVSNPPYYRQGEGRLCADPARAVARHETRMTLEGLVRVSSRLLRKGGTLSLSMIHMRRGEYERILSEYGFYESRFREVRAAAGKPPAIFLSEARLGERGERVALPPLDLRSPGGGDSEEFSRIAARYS